MNLKHEEPFYHTKNPGMVVELQDGRIGIAYNKEQIHKDKYTIKLFHKNYQPIISEKTGKQAIVFRLHTEIKLIGFVD